MGDQRVRDTDDGPPNEMRACAQCLKPVYWARLGDDEPWFTRCPEHETALTITLAEADKLRREKERQRAFVDAALLRALAAVVESSGEPLRTWGSDGCTKPGVESEIRRRIA